MRNAALRIVATNPQTYADIGREEDFIINHYEAGCIDIDAHDWCLEEDGEISRCQRCGILE